MTPVGTTQSHEPVALNSRTVYATPPTSMLLDDGEHAAARTGCAGSAVNAATVKMSAPTTRVHLERRITKAFFRGPSGTPRVRRPYCAVRTANPRVVPSLRASGDALSAEAVDVDVVAGN